MRRTWTMIVAALGATTVLGVTGCSSGAPPTGATGPAPGQAVVYPVTVGGVTLAQRPTRVVSISATATEMLHAVGAGDQIAAVDSKSNYPPGVAPGELSAASPDADAIAAKNPDLVILADDIGNVVAKLTQRNIPVYQAPPAATLGDTYRQISEIGALTGHSAEAGEVVHRMTEAIAKVVAELPERVKTLTYYHELDQSYRSVTGQSFIGSVYSMLGLTSIAAEGSGSPKLPAQTIIKADPDLIFLADTKCCGQSPDTVKARPGWANMKAVKTNQVYQLDDEIAARWGPRVVDLVTRVAGAASQVPS